MGATIKMALQVEWETPYGITCNNGYATIETLNTSKQVDRTWQEYDENEPGVPNPNNEWIVTKEFIVKYNVRVWADKDAYDEDKAAIGGYNGRLVINKNTGKTQYNLVKQCYLDLKTQDGWTDATDC